MEKTSQNNTHACETSIIGYPRIGKQREWKKALEQYWAGKSSYADFTVTMQEIEKGRLQTLIDAQLTYIPVHDYTWYDHVLDTSMMFGIIPQRFRNTYSNVIVRETERLSNDTWTQSFADLAFAIARGDQTSPASEMTKWFNTNYHYIVPEWEEQQPELLYNAPLAAWNRARQAFPHVASAVWKPVVVGPYTYVRLMKGMDPSERIRILKSFIPVYLEMLQALEEASVAVVQLDEPAFVLTMSEQEWLEVDACYKELRANLPKLKLWVQTYFEAVSDYTVFSALSVDILGLDFVHGRERNAAAVVQHGFPRDKQIAIGVIDGRNVWRTDLQETAEWLNEYLKPHVDKERWIIQPSCSLLHVPISLADETTLPEYIKQALAGADEKLNEVAALANALVLPTEEDHEKLAVSHEAVQAWRQAPERQHPEVRKSLKELLNNDAAWERIPFQQRLRLHEQRWSTMPALPTTTIGSLPQSADVRKARLLYRKGEWNKQQYQQYIEAEIARWIRIQEDLDIDVLVHGEFERTDMVEYFGEKLDGFVFTINGWVQSYGSRCVKPPVLYGDVAFVQPMTVEETVYAQSITSKPVKGMLTGPVTILNWSFVRDDIPRDQTCYQLAWALRQEVEALEAAGIGMIQVDEPAVKEGMPLNPEDRNAYRHWAVEAFRITTSVAAPETQIHTHMCYCDFSDMIGLIREMDADVISIESARSGDDLLQIFASEQYDLGIGLGVYDIHSPRVPQTDDMSASITRALDVLPARTFWINPDCGLKTRQEPETIEALRRMVEAAKAAREQRLLVR